MHRRPSPVLARLGLRRASWVRVELDDDGRPAHCEVAGIGHRLPVRRAIPFAVAAALLAAGVPGVVRACDAEPAG